MHEFLDTNRIEVTNISVVNEDMVEIFYKYNEDDIPVSPNLNIFVAAFTTCWARLHLYEALELLQERVLYFDTNSVLYKEDTQDPIQPQPVLGDYLGEFTNELDDGDYIVEFFSAGPKNYGYVTAQGKTECKVKGFRLNSEGKAELNFKIMRDNVAQEIQNPLKDPREHQVIKSFQINRDPKDYQITTEMESKFYKLVFDKRVVDAETFMTYPYGYFQGQWT